MKSGRKTSALAYPALLFLGILLVLHHTLFVVPAFDHMFEDYGVLTGATQVVVSLSRRTNPIRLLSTLIAGFTAILA